MTYKTPVIMFCHELSDVNDEKGRIVFRAQKSVKVTVGIGTSVKRVLVAVNNRMKVTRNKSKWYLDKSSARGIILTNVNFSKEFHFITSVIVTCYKIYKRWFQYTSCKKSTQTWF